jgi:hypothetical protein
MDHINNESKAEKYVFITESGSCYILTIDRDQAKWLERDNLNQPMLRRDNQKIYVQAIFTWQLGSRRYFSWNCWDRAMSRSVIRQLWSKCMRFSCSSLSIG